MITSTNISKPIERSSLRKFIGKEYFIAKRQFQWITHPFSYAKVDKKTTLPYAVFQHRSFLLRPLKNVDMQLQYNKVTNLRIAISHINEVVIKPGETFSLWKMVGRPTKEKGYLDGLMLDNGKIKSGIGGGLCQLGNLLYWLILHSPLTVTERYRHAYDVFPDINRTIPFACGATLAYNYIDLQFKNETQHSFKLNLWLDEEYLNGELTCSNAPVYEYEIFETDHLMQLQWWGGYTRHNKIWKRKTNLFSGEISEELVTENHAIMMYNPLLK